MAKAAVILETLYQSRSPWRGRDSVSAETRSHRPWFRRFRGSTTCGPTCWTCWKRGDSIWCKQLRQKQWSGRHNIRKLSKSLPILYTDRDGLALEKGQEFKERNNAKYVVLTHVITNYVATWVSSRFFRHIVYQHPRIGEVPKTNCDRSLVYLGFCRMLSIHQLQSHPTMDFQFWAIWFHTWLSHSPGTSEKLPCQ